MYRYLSIGLLLAAIVIVGVLVYQVLAVFFVPLFIAALLVVVFRPMHRRILRLVRQRKKTAALLSTILILFLVLMPVVVLGVVAAAESRSLIRALTSSDIETRLRGFRGRAALELPAADKFRKLETVVDAIRSETLELDPDSQRSQLLYNAGELRSLGRELAAALALPWPSGDAAVEDAVDPEFLTPGMSHWNAFAQLLETIRDGLNDDAAWSALGHESRLDLCAGHRSNLELAIREYFSFKTAWLGGPIRSWLIEIANPDESQARAYVSGLTSWVQQKVVSFGGATTAFVVRFFFGLIIMVLALFTFFLDGPALLEGLKRLTPLDNAYKDELALEFEKVSRSVVMAIVFAAIAQGIAGVIGYYFAGLQSLFLLMILTMVLALVPFLGAAAVWVPCALYILFIEGRTGAGIFLSIYGVAVISMIDNIVKPLVLQGRSNLHPLLALLSILGGIAALGPIGIVVGPMVVVFLETLLNILQREMVVARQQLELDTQSTSGKPAQARG